MILGHIRELYHRSKGLRLHEQLARDYDGLAKVKGYLGVKSISPFLRRMISNANLTGRPAIRLGSGGIAFNYRKRTRNIRGDESLY